VIPKVDGNIFVGAAEAGNEMVFEGANGMFSSIVPVNMWGN